MRFFGSSPRRHHFAAEHHPLERGDLSNVLERVLPQHDDVGLGSRTKQSERISARRQRAVTRSRYDRLHRRHSELDETLKRYPTWEIDESRLERIHTSTVRGYTSVPMRVR